MTLSRGLEDELITRKQVRDTPNNPEIKARRVEFETWMYDEWIHKHRV